MSRHLAVFTLILALVGPPAAAAAAAAAAPPARHPVVVELFTSNSCSSCPPAYRALDRLAASADASHPLIRLDEHVDYWNDLDWVDRYSRHAYTQRQRHYASAVFHQDQVYTPQLVIDGRVALIGSDERAARRDIARLADRVAPLSPMIRSHGDRVSVRLAGGSVPPGDRLWFALTQDHVVAHVGRGENAGRVLRENGVVRTLVAARAGTTHATLTLPHDAPPTDLHVVAFVQTADGRIVAAGQRSLAVTHRGAG